MSHTDYEIYDLSGGWDDFLKKNIMFNTDSHTKIINEITSEDGKRAQLAAIQGNEKVLASIEKYMRMDMTLKVFPNQAKRLFWVLIENCFFYKTECGKYKRKAEARKRALLEIKEAVSADNLDEVKKIIESISSKSKESDPAPDTPDEADVH